jgi:hypothetical protein
VLLTEDKDFGQLVHAGREDASGVVFIHFPGSARATLPSAVLDLVERFGDRLPVSFVVLEPGRVRIGSLRPQQENE